MTNELEIIQGCKNNDSYAQRVLFERYGAQMKAVCGLYVKNADQKEDLLQESFIKIFSKINDFDSRGVLRAWIRRIVVNTCLGYITRDKYAKNMVSSSDSLQYNEEIEDEEDEDDSEFDTLVEALDGETIHGCISLLKEDYRIVFVMFCIDDMSHNEISSVLNITVGASRVRLNRAKEALKKLLLEVSTKEIKV